MKAIVADLMSVSGHVALNKFYVGVFNRKIEVDLFLGESISGYFSSISRYNDFSLSKGRVSRTIFLISVILKLFSYARSTNAKVIILLSYPLYLMPLIMIFSNILNLKIITFEHNTVRHFSEKITLTLFVNLFSSYPTRLVYTERIAKEFSKIKGSTHVIPHPILTKMSDKKNLENRENICFVPSSNLDPHKLIPLVKDNDDIFFFIKDIGEALDPIRNANNVNIQPFFDEYEKIMDECHFVFASFDQDLRVSGPFYEALGKGKKILLDDNWFGNLMLEQFDGYVDSSVIDIYKTKKKPVFNCKDYNDNISSNLINVVGQL